MRDNELLYSVIRVVRKIIWISTTYIHAVILCTVFFKRASVVFPILKEEKDMPNL